ncbi:MAG TPA: AI-2E family transporter [Candidatus Eisenbacteria bacterium]|nr:AI-2E family transporter [Candidatus Eisenbacteria bacterium]
MPRNFILFAFFVVLLLFVLSQVVLILSPFLQPLFWATILAFAFYPIHVKVRRSLNGRENLAAAATTSMIVLAFVPLLLFTVVSLAAESVKLYSGVLTFLQENRQEAMLAHLRGLPLVQRLEDVAFRWGVVRENYREWLTGSLASAGNYAAMHAAQIARGALLAPFHFFLTFFLLFFLLRDGGRIYRFLYEITPMEEENKRDVFSQVTGTFEAVIRGQLLTAMAQALLAGVIFWSLGVPLPILFAALTFLAALIPLFGAPLVWFPLSVYLFLQVSHAKAAALFLLGAFGISLVDNFLKPILIGEKTKLPYLLLFLGILGGMQIYGLMGIFLAPTFLSLFFVVIKIYREKYL